MGGEGEVVVWRRANVSVSDIVALFSSLESSRKQLDDVNNDDSSCNSDNTDGDYQISGKPRYILRAAEEDGSIMEDLPTLSTTADVRSIGVSDFCLIDAVSGVVHCLIKIEELDNESDSESFFNFENDSNGSSEISSQKSGPILIETTNVNSSHSSVGSLLSYKKNSVQLADTISTSQGSTTPPQSNCLSRPALEKRSTTSEPSETDTYTSGEIWSRNPLIRDRMSSFHSGISHVSGGSKWGKNNGSCMILVKTREPISETSGISDVDWKLFKKLVIDVDSHDNMNSHSKYTRGHRSRNNSIQPLPTIPSEDYEGEDSAIIIDNDDEEDDDEDDDDEDDGMYYYDENNEIVFEGSTLKVLNDSVDSRPSEDGTSFFGEFEVDDA